MNEINWYQEVLLRKDTLLEDLNKLLKIESIKDLDSKSERNPMGNNIGEALEYMLALSSREGFSTTNIDGYVGFAEYGKSDEYIGILCHLDVVPASGQWMFPPFSPTIENGKLYARGSSDDKGPTIAAFYGLKIVKELGLPIKNNVRIIFGTDEESGMSCIKKYIQTQKQPIAGFSPDAVFPIINAEKGQINLTLRQKELSLIKLNNTSWDNFKLIYLKSGERSNMVPNMATASIVSNNPTELINSFQEYCAKKNLIGSYSMEKDNITLSIQGKSAHAMEPYKGVNAGILLCHFLKRFLFDSIGQQYLSFIDTLFYEDFYGRALEINYSDEISGDLTVNAGIFEYNEVTGGTLKINIRYPVTTHYLRTIEQLTNKIESMGFEVYEIRQKKPHYLDKNHPLIKTLQKVYQEETHLEPYLLSTGGNTYAGLMDYCVAFGAGFPQKEMTAHKENEYIEIEDLLKATAIYARATYELANIDI